MVTNSVNSKQVLTLIPQLRQQTDQHRQILGTELDDDPSDQRKRFADVSDPCSKKSEMIWREQLVPR